MGKPWPRGEPMAASNCVEAQQGIVYSVSWSPDGQTLATGGADGSVKLLTIENLDGLLERGCYWLRSYLVNNLEDLQKLDACQTPEILLAAAPTLVEESDEFARNGNVEAAIQGYRTAQQWGISLDFDPVAQANRLAQQEAAIALAQHVWKH